MEERALDLLEAAYRVAKYQERGGRRLLLTFLDGDVATSVGLNPSPKSTSPEARTYRWAVNFLLDSGAVDIPDILDQQIPETTFYEITPDGIDMLRKARRIP